MEYELPVYCIGLFGTCDNVPWRDNFIRSYEMQHIEYFNPDVGDNWHPGMVDLENQHLMTDDVILFPVLAASLGTGSLGELGFSVLNVVRNVMNGSNQYLIILIDDECTDVRKTENERANSNKARALVKSKVKAVNHPNIILVEDIERMYELSIKALRSLNEIEDLHHPLTITA